MKAWIGRIAWSPDGKVLASHVSGQDHPAVGCRDGECLRTLTAHGGAVWYVAFDPTGRTLVTASVDKTVMLWDPNSGQLIRSLEGHMVSVYCVAFDPTGLTLASAGSDLTVKVWDAGSGQLLRSLEAIPMAYAQSPFPRIATFSHRKAWTTPFASGVAT